MIEARNWIAAVMAAASLAAGTASAQEAIGQISASIDGEALEWRTLGTDDSGTDYNTSLQAFGPMRTVSIMGFPPGRVTMRGTIQLTFTLMEGSFATVEQEVIHAPEGLGRVWTSLEGEDLITIESFEAGADTGGVSGRISGRVCLKESLFAEPDVGTCKPIEGSFISRLPLSDGL
jgi:hypothetical protein